MKERNKQIGLGWAEEGKTVCNKNEKLLFIGTQGKGLTVDEARQLSKNKPLVGLKRSWSRADPGFHSLKLTVF